VAGSTPVKVRRPSAASTSPNTRTRAGTKWPASPDAAYSGATFNRPGIQALKRQIEQGLIRVVLIFKLERVLRSTDEWAPFRTFLQQHDCRLVSTTEDLSEDTPSGRLKNNLLVSVAEYERLNTAEKVRAKMLAQAKRGYWNYGAVPYGHAYSSQSQMLTANDVEAVVVRRVFESAARLTPLGEIAEGLNSEGLRTRVREYRHRDGAAQQVGGRRFGGSPSPWGRHFRPAGPMGRRVFFRARGRFRTRPDYGVAARASSRYLTFSAKSRKSVRWRM